MGIAVGISVGDWYTTGKFIGGAFGAGAAGGFAGGFVGTGGNLKSAFIGGFTGGLAGQIGQKFGTAPGTFASAEAIASHAALGCASATLSGGDCGSGALAGGFTKITSPYIAEFAGSTTFSDKFTGALMAGTVGGTVSELTGGKFANGAITGAFAYLYNQMFYNGELSPKEALQRQQERNNAVMRACVSGYTERCSGISDFEYTEKQTAAQRALIRRATGQAANDAAFVLEAGSPFSGPLAPKLVGASLALRAYSTWALPPTQRDILFDAAGVAATVATYNKNPFIESGASITIEILKRTSGE